MNPQPAHRRTDRRGYAMLLAMLLIGGPSIRGLLLVVAIGVVVGTYSSIFVASQFIVIWDRGEVRKLLRLGRGGASAGGGGRSPLRHRKSAERSCLA